MNHTEIALAEARGRREAYQTIRADLSRELRGAPYNAPPQAQLTYVGGLARARRLAERLYRTALNAEEDLVIGDVTARQIDDSAEAILVAHQRHHSGCLCGWAELGKSHPRHQVAMLRSAALLADQGGGGEPLTLCLACSAPLP